jgi:hypothetical protein
MKRTLIAVMALVGLASAANATVSLVLAADHATYNVGDTITLKATGTANASEVSTAVFGEMLLDNPGALSGGAASQVALQSFGGFVTWVVGTNPCTTSSCTMMNQIGGVSDIPVSNTPLVVATATFQAAAPGVVNATWEASTFNWFGLGLGGGAVPNGTSFTIVPEPTTAAMLGLGLFGLAVAGRRRA